MAEQQRISNISTSITISRVKTCFKVSVSVHVVIKNISMESVEKNDQ